MKNIIFILFLFMSSYVSSQNRVTTSVGVTLISIKDTTINTAMMLETNKTYTLSKGMSIQYMNRTYERPLNIVKMSNGKEKWTYDKTVVYMKDGKIDIIRNL